MIIAIEGIDGVGKGTQSTLLYDKLLARGFKARLLTFPAYSSFFGKMIAEYLNGSYGSLDAIHPKLVANIYACDRRLYFDSLNLDDYDFVVIDRYVASNLAHQSVKSNSDQKEILAWINELEYEVFRLPEPDLVIVLDAPVEVATRQVLSKSGRDYTTLKKDLHESNDSYLSKVREVFFHLGTTYEPYTLVNCCSENKMRSIKSIQEEVWQLVSRKFDLDKEAALTT